MTEEEQEVVKQAVAILGRVTGDQLREQYPEFESLDEEGQAEITADLTLDDWSSLTHFVDAVTDIATDKRG